MKEKLENRKINSDERLGENSFGIKLKFRIPRTLNFDQYKDENNKIRMGHYVFAENKIMYVGDAFIKCRASFRSNMGKTNWDFTPLLDRFFEGVKDYKTYIRWLLYKNILVAEYYLFNGKRRRMYAFNIPSEWQDLKTELVEDFKLTIAVCKQELKWREL